MLVSDIQTAARDLYNATGDSFFSDTQLNNWIFQGQIEFCKEAFLIESQTSSSTVASTQAYAFPTNAISIKRITINGRKIKRITQRQDDSITLSNQAVTASGWPIYYYEFNQSVYLRPIPDAIYTMVTFTNNMPAAITNASTPDIPALFHFDLVDYCLYRMFSKDKDVTNMQFHKTVWMEHLSRAKSFKATQKRTDSFVTVQDEETLPVTILGEA